MLTGDLAISFQRGEKVTPKSLNASDAGILQLAADLIFLVRQHVHQSRAQLQSAFDDYIGVGTDYKILRGLMKLLLDRCEFSTSGVKDAIGLRQALFTQAASAHPILDELVRQQVISQIAEQLGCQSVEVTQGLYADLPANHILVAFDEPQPQALIEDYNLAQAQALLYHCVEMRLRFEPAQTLEAIQSLRAVLQTIKNYRLIYSIRGNAEVGYEVRLNGPVSLFHRSQKYGIQLAVFFPALLLYSGWHLRAEIETKRGRAFYEISYAQKDLQTNLLRELMKPENDLLEKLKTQWKSIDWVMLENFSILDIGDMVLVPDLIFEQTNEKRFFAEIIGYWTPGYLRERIILLERHSIKNYLFLVSEELRCSHQELSPLPPQIFLCKKSIKVKDLEFYLHHLL